MIVYERRKGVCKIVGVGYKFRVLLVLVILDGVGFLSVIFFLLIDVIC